RRVMTRPGLYPARSTDQAVHCGQWGEKLVFWYEVFKDPSMTKAIVLFRQYNVERDKAGRFVFGDGHHYRHDWIRANGGKHAGDWKRLPPHVFQNVTLWVEVVTVTKDGRKRPIHPSLYYSKVSMIVRPFNEKDVFKTYPVQLDEVTYEMP